MLFILYLCLYLDFKELLDNMLSDTVRWPFSRGVWHACLRGKIGGREKVNKKKNRETIRIYGSRLTHWREKKLILVWEWHSFVRRGGGGGGSKIVALKKLFVFFFSLKCLLSWIDCSIMPPMAIPVISDRRMKKNRRGKLLLSIKLGRKPR